MNIYWGNYDAMPNPMQYADSDLYLPGIKLSENNPGFRNAKHYTYLYHDSGMPKQRYTKMQSHLHMLAFVDNYHYE